MSKQTSIDSNEVNKFAELSSSWWDRNGPLKTLHDINPARLDFIEQYTSLKDKTVLDVGCGGGILSLAMAEKGAKVTGLDVEKESLEVAKEKAIKKKLEVNFVCTPIENYQEQTFELVTCMEMLEHVANPTLVIEHCAKRLNKGGLLFLSTINRTLQGYASAIIVAEYLLKLLPRQTHDFDKFIKPSELASMARASGLRLLSMSGIAYNPFTRLASLQDSVSVNYLMAFVKED